MLTLSAKFKAFNSVHREALWPLLRHHEILTGILNLLTVLHSGNGRAVKCEKVRLYPAFLVNARVRKAGVLASSYFSTCMD